MSLKNFAAALAFTGLGVVLAHSAPSLQAQPATETQSSVTVPPRTASLDHRHPPNTMEYTCTTIPDAGDRDDGAMTRRLNEFGREGWNLVTLLPRGIGVQACFKRPGH